MKRSVAKNSGPLHLSKNSKKYVPTPEEAIIISSYFRHNNFQVLLVGCQDFNTWQQISRSKCEFDYNQTKAGNFECKATLKWDDMSMPVIVGVGASRNKRNAKKRALNKLIENLIYLGLIGYGFREPDFLKKIPKRLKQSQDEESSLEVVYLDQKYKQLLQDKQYDQLLQQINPNNFSKMMSQVLREDNLDMFVRALRKMQHNNEEGDIETEAAGEDGEVEQWQDYQFQLKDPYHQDLADILRYYQLQLALATQAPQQLSVPKTCHMKLPFIRDSASQSNSFQFFYPIEYSFIFRRNIISRQEQADNKKSAYFSEFYMEIPLPKFEFEGIKPLPYKTVLKILKISLQFSYKYQKLVRILSIIEREVKSCCIEHSSDEQGQKFFLQQMISLTAQFGILLWKKSQNLSLSLEGLINVQNDGVISFIPKEPEQIVQQKVLKKTNTNQIEQMVEFTNEQFVILVSKIDPSVFYIGQIVESWPIIKIHSHSFAHDEQKQKIPYTMYKLANAKVYNQLCKSISHFGRSSMEQIQANTFIIQQKPTYSILGVIFEMVAEWCALNEPILVVSQNFNEINAFLLEKGFKTARITSKTEEKNILKKQAICCSPTGVCSDAIRNYAFTRVIIEGAHHISQAVSTLAFNKGCKKLYLIGDSILPSELVLSNFAKNRHFSQSLLHKFRHEAKEIYCFDQMVEPHYFNTPIFEVLNNYFYQKQLRREFIFDTPSIKGFPWPCQFEKLCFIHIPCDQNYKRRQIEITCLIVFNVIKSGFITANQIACRVVSPKSRALLVASLHQYFNKFGELSVKADVLERMVDYVSGSRFRQKNLCILMAEPKQFDLSYLVAGLQQSRRGFIVFGDFNLLAKQPKWQPVLTWAQSKKLIVTPK